MDVLLQVRIENVLQHSWVSVIVLRNYQDQSVSALTGFRESLVLYLLSRIVAGKLQFSNVDELTFDGFTSFDLLENKLRDVFTRAALSNCAEDYGNEEWATVHGLYLSSNAITWPSGSRANNPLLKPKFLSLSVTTPDETKREFSASNRFANDSVVFTIKVVCQ